MTDTLQKIPAVKKDPADTLKHVPAEMPPHPETSGE